MIELVQETRRGGRDGRQVEAILYDKIIGKKITTAMRDYQENVRNAEEGNLDTFCLSSEEDYFLLKFVVAVLYV